MRHRTIVTRASPGGYKKSERTRAAAAALDGAAKPSVQYGPEWRVSTRHCVNDEVPLP